KGEGTGSAACASLAAPELFGGEASAFGQGAELGEDKVGVDLGAEDALGEAAVGASDDVLAADQIGKAGDALAHELGVLDDVVRVADAAGDEDLAVGELCFLPDLPLPVVARVLVVGEAGGAHLEDEVDELGQGDVFGVRAAAAAVANVEADLVFGQ